MERHRDLCSKVIAKMPEEGKSTLSFKNFHKQMNVPFVIYADFECVLKKVDNLDMVINKHLPCAFSFNVKCNFDSNLDELFIYTGRDAAEKFVEMLNSKCREIFNTYLSVKKPMTPLTPSQILEFENAKICHICDKELGSDKVHDHCHITGRYRGAAHKECNINYTVPTFIPILFHNFSGYDCHLFIKELIKYIPSKKTNIIPQNKELYISVSHVVDMGNGRELEYRFLDSFRFMAASLETLANNLEDADLKSVRAHFPIDNQFNLMRRKGIFCYEYLDSFDKLNDTILPPIEKFYSNLYNTSCSIDDYEHAKRVWETFNCQSLKDYMELYLKTDVLLLTDVFENFRKSCKRVHKLDPCQYYTAPGLSFDAMLRFTKITLDLLRDLNMFNVIKKGIRGGLVQCTKRLAKANNKYMKDYDKNSPSHYLLYLDANNLYGWAMKQYLPEGDFKWLQPEEAITDVEEILKFMHNSTIGYIYVVDLEYPEELHDLHNDLPFCAENKKVGDSKYEKLIADFSPKKNYAIHYMVLKQCLENGLKLAKVHFVISFRQSPWLAPYIDKNTSERQKASNSFLKDLYKLYNNSVFGKTMENVDKRKNIKLVNHWDYRDRRRIGAQKLISKPNFHSASQFDDELWAIQMNKTNVTYNKPIYLGFCILELSKYRMYDFFYGYIKKKYGNRATLCYTDTDSFILDIETDDVYEDIKSDIDLQYDTSDYPEDNIYKIPRKNKKIIGMMKDENCGKIMTMFIGLGPKMYSFQVEDGEEVKKAKGVKKCIISKYSINDYKECLLNEKISRDVMINFRSKMHQVYTNKMFKIVLSCKDTKRKIKADKINTYAWGHKNIENEYLNSINFDFSIPLDMELDLSSSSINDDELDRYLNIDEDYLNNINFNFSIPMDLDFPSIDNDELNVYLN